LLTRTVRKLSSNKEKITQYHIDVGASFIPTVPPPFQDWESG